MFSQVLLSGSIPKECEPNNLDISTVLRKNENHSYLIGY